MNDLLAGTSLIIGIAAANAAQDNIGFQNESNRWERMLPPDSPHIYDPELEKLKKNPPKNLF